MDPPALMSAPNTTETDINMTDQPTAPRKIVRRQNNSNPLVARRPPMPPQVAGKPIVPRGARPLESRPTPPQPLNIPNTSQATEVPEEEWQTFKLTTTKSSILRGLRHNVMRLQSKKAIDPTDPEQFTRPVRLHRRDPAAPLQGGQSVQAASTDAAEDVNMDPEERAKEEAEKAQKEADRAATLEKIAPYGGAQRQKQNAFKKKTQQVFKQNMTEKKLRYEEMIPWFIEDFDNKNTWQGQLESQLSHGSYAILALDGSNFRMIPIDKWYKFVEKNKFQVMNIEEAELALKKTSKAPRWMMKLIGQDEKDKAKKERAENMKAFTRGLNLRRGGRLDHVLPKSETADADELDFDDDRFADDEEAPVMEGEEQENKEIEQRIKKEQLSANSFNLRDEKDYEAEEREREKVEKARKNNRSYKKYLMRREGNFTYEEDSDGNPYGSSSEESDDDEEVARKEEERKKEDEQKKKENEAREQDKGKKPQTSSSVSLDAKSDPSITKRITKPGPSSADKLNAKRTGSADLSESGNEKSRKKPRKTQPVGNNSSLASVSSKISQKKRKAGGDGSGDDTAGEMSDGAGASKKHRGSTVVPNSHKLSPPANSRQVSPTPGNGSSSRTGSPVTSTSTPRAGSPISAQPLTDEEIRALFNNGPITTQQIAKSLGTRLRNASVKAALVAALKRMTVTRDKLLHLKE
ncbi:hypothetical protein EDC01DRAFT_228174 [Geopyxis carbonaria]|nr:hypothetical protein EDC01DRAFT_228174 [Geopyxis carbonaria]